MPWIPCIVDFQFAKNSVALEPLSCRLSFNNPHRPALCWNLCPVAQHSTYTSVVLESLPYSTTLHIAQRCVGISVDQHSTETSVVLESL